MAQGRAKHWVFTINNWNDGDVERLSSLFPEQCSYLVYGREVGEQGTPHLQGYIAFIACTRFNAARALLGGPRAHIEIARGTPQQAAAYAKKDGDYTEHGSLPRGQGARNDLRAFFDAAEEYHAETGQPLNTPEAIRRFPDIVCRYPNATNIARRRIELEPLVVGEPQQWQVDLEQRLDGPPDDRSIMFYIDEPGGKGKTWFQKYYFQKHQDTTQILGIAKRDDLALMISENTRVFFLNVPRSQMEYLQYSVLEMMKDRIVVSPKYHSRTKILATTPHVVVFSNEWPDMNKLSQDRYNIINLE